MLALGVFIGNDLGNPLETGVAVKHLKVVLLGDAADNLSCYDGLHDVLLTGHLAQLGVLCYDVVEENHCGLVTVEQGKLTFVITGDVHRFKNRDAFKAYVEQNGGKVAGSVSKKTSFLVNNDVESTSSKNLKARELGIPGIKQFPYSQSFL